jgi:hypothetical protein
MNDYELMNSIFSNFIVNGKTIPAGYLTYDGKETTYITYTFTADRPALFGDDKELESVISIDIDIFSKGNFLAIEDKVKEVMENNDFIRIDSSPDMYEKETGLYHKTLEFEKVRNK